MLASRSLSRSNAALSHRSCLRPLLSASRPRNLHLGSQFSASRPPSALSRISLSSRTASAAVFSVQSRSFWGKSDTPSPELFVTAPPSKPAAEATPAPELLAEPVTVDNAAATTAEAGNAVAATSDSLLEAVARTPLPEGTNGYLHSLGLDHGWGPSSLLQWGLEHVHNLSGLGWAGSIILTVVIVRGLQLPFYCKMSHHAALLKELAPMTVQFTDKAKECQRRGDTAGMMVQRAEMLKVYKQAGVKQKWLMFPLTQIPIFYGFYNVLNQMSALPVPALINDGFFWFQNLAVADPYYILPIATSALLGTTFFLGGEAGNNNLGRSTRILLGIAFPALSFAATCTWPAAMTLYFCTTAMWGVFQSMLFRNNAFRKMMGMHPMKSNLPNPLADSTPLPKLRVDPETLAHLKGPEPVVAGPQKRQFGGEGSFLDRITGGKMPENTSLLDRVLGGKGDEKGSSMSVSNWLKEGKERQLASEHKAYEQKRKKRLEAERKQAELERERRRRAREL